MINTTYKTLIYTIMFFVVTATSACEAGRPGHNGARSNNSAHKGITSICAIADNPSAYIGKTVSLHGLYQTDYSSFTFINDFHGGVNRCPDFLIQMIDAHSGNDASVDDFYRSGRERCMKKSGGASCLQKAFVSLDGKILKVNGLIYIHIYKIMHYKYYK